jgi:hypothetical protein
MATRTHEHGATRTKLSAGSDRGAWALSCNAILAGVVCALAAVAASSAIASGTPRRERCARERSVTLISTTLVRIYRDRRTTNGALVYACHRPTGHATQLGAVLPQGLFQYGGTATTAIDGTPFKGLGVPPARSDVVGRVGVDVRQRPGARVLQHVNLVDAVDPDGTFMHRWQPGLKSHHPGRTVSLESR